MKCVMVMLALLLASCSAGPGMNKYYSFAPPNRIILPVTVVVDDGTSKVEATPLPDEQLRNQMIVMFGLAGALVNSSGMQDGIRGKFQAGRAFQETTMGLFQPGSDSPSDTLELKLISFKYFTRPDRPRAEMMFTARLLGVNEMVASECVF